MPNVLGIFPVGDTGEEMLVTVQWHPDPELLAAKIFDMADNWDNWLEPMVEARHILVDSTHRRFDTETDPYGDHWAELSEDYHEQKLAEGYPDQILVRSGDMERAAVSNSSWFIDENAIFFKAENLPSYGALHQYGTEEAGGQHKALIESASAKLRGGLGMFSLSREERTALDKGGRGLSLPQRMFIGADEQAINEIEAVFIRHMEKTIEGPWDDPIPDWGPYGLGYGMSAHGEFPVYRLLPSGQPLLRTPRGGFMFGRMGSQAPRYHY